MRHLGLILLAACTSGGSDTDWDPQAVANDGEICLFGAEPTEATDETFFTQNRPVWVRFTVDGCMSSSCTREQTATCTVTANGSTFEVRGEAAWESRGGACTDDCPRLSATCMTTPLADGSYTFEFANKSLVLTVPRIPSAPPCVRSN